MQHPAKGDLEWFRGEQHPAQEGSAQADEADRQQEDPGDAGADEDRDPRAAREEPVADPVQGRPRRGLNELTGGDIAAGDSPIGARVDGLPEPAEPHGDDAGMFLLIGVGEAALREGVPEIRRTACPAGFVRGQEDVEVRQAQRERQAEEEEGEERGAAEGA